MIGIYIIYWNNNKYFYYGQTKNFLSRKREHLSQLKHNKHPNKFLQSIYNKYGIPNIEIVEECNIDELDKIEQRIITAWKFLPNCCNILSIVKSSSGYKHTNEHKKYISEKLKGKIHPNSTAGIIEWHKKRKLGMVDYKPGRKTIKFDLGEHPMSKKVIDMNTNIIYDCAKSASISLNINYSTIKKYLQGRTKSISNFKYIN